MSDNFDLVVIGSGPGGYVAAIRAAQLGMKVACVEKDAALGGTCLNVGCIPSKALLESSERFADAKSHLAEHGVKVGAVDLDLDTMLSRKDKIVKQLTGGLAMLFKKNGIERLTGLGRLSGSGAVQVVDAAGSVTRTVVGRNVLIATGSVPSSLPGITLDGERVVTSTEALSFAGVPEHLIVIGAGVIGLELGSVWARLGANVTVLEYMPRLLPFCDEDIAKVAQRAFTKQGLEFRFGVKVTGTRVDGAAAIVTFEENGASVDLRADRVLVAVGRRPNTEGLGADKAGVALDSRGRVVIDDHFRTNVPGVWAIGDVVRGAMLAHKAEDEGMAAAEIMAGLPGHVNYDAIPSIVYTHPEIATVGRPAHELQAAGIPIRTGSFPYAPNGRAKALGESDGLVKIVAHAETDRILGAQIVGARAGDMIAELAIAIEFSASAEDIARSSHAHPTLAEVIREAALAVAGRTIHM
jgi:dihydrolipoamide dehydrogenase